MAYSSILKPSTFMNTVLYTGNGGSSNSVTGVGFKPDWVWIKNRTQSAESTSSHALTDIVRGVTKTLRTNSDTLQTTDANGLTAFGTDGFTVSDKQIVNGNNDALVAWNWKAGTSVSGNTSGSGTAKAYSGSVNTTSGFSIITYVGNLTAGHTIPHHLGAAPSMVICKSIVENRGWPIQHASLTSAAYSIFLSTTGTESNGSNSWNSTAASSSVVTLGNNESNNKNDNSYIMYSFAQKQGYSKFGKYTANAIVDGNFIFTGFKPSFILIKAFNAAQDGQSWFIYDSSRDPGNTATQTLQPNTSAAEQTNVAPIDILSNGFKLRTNTGRINGTNGEYIFMAFAEEPFVASNFNAATAR